MPKTQDKRSYYSDLAKLTEFNLHLLRESGEVILDREDLENKHEKTIGATVGYIVEDQDGKIYMLKKNARFREGLSPDDNDARTKSQDMNLMQNITESFREKCAAELFSILKQEQEYAPKFYLVVSGYNKNGFKIYNQLKLANKKVYIASEIIGNPDEVNKEFSRADYDASTPEKIKNDKDQTRLSLHNQQTEDLCRNAVLMIILSNYDIQWGNYIFNERGQAIPIDFGNSWLEERGNPDVLCGLNIIRRRIDNFSSSDLKNAFLAEEGRKGVQVFYDKNIKTSHILHIINSLKGKKELEQDVWNGAYKYSFGTTEEKIKHANVTVARIRNLLMLEGPLKEFEDKVKNKIFKNSNLETKDVRTLFAQSLAFINSNKDRDLIKFTKDSFDELEQNQEELMDAISKYDEELQSLKGANKDKIYGLVGEFNSKLVSFYSEIQQKFELLKSQYDDSGYISGSDKLPSVDNEFGDRDKMLSKILEFIEALNQPLIDLQSDQDQGEKVVEQEEDVEGLFDGNIMNIGENSLGVKSASSSESSSASTAFPSRTVTFAARAKNDNQSEFKSIEKCGVEWDLSRHNEYKERLAGIIKYIGDTEKEVMPRLYNMSTHLSAYDTLYQVEKENFYERYSTKNQSDQPKPASQEPSNHPKTVFELIQLSRATANVPLL